MLEWLFVFLAIGTVFIVPIFAVALICLPVEAVEKALHRRKMAKVARATALNTWKRKWGVR